MPLFPCPAAAAATAAHSCHWQGLQVPERVVDALMMRLDKDRDGSVDISEFFERMGQLKTDLAQRLKEELALAQLKEQRGVLREPSLDQIKLMEVPELQGLMERRAAKVHEEEQRQAAVRRAKDLQGMGVPVRDALLDGRTRPLPRGEV